MSGVAFGTSGVRRAARKLGVEGAAFGGAAASGDERLWEEVLRVVGEAALLDDLRSHRLELLALTCWERLGREIPKRLVAEARAVAMTSLSAPLLLRRVRESCDGPIVLLKGPETSAAYPEPGLRAFGDLDLLVPDAIAVQGALVAAGFKPLGEEEIYLGTHQLQPLHHEGFPLLVEVHTRPKWVQGISPPRVEELFEVAVESVVPVAGISALPRAHHAVLLAAHSWAHEPLGSLGQLIDIAAARQGASPLEVDALAKSWGIERIWRTTVAAIDAVFFGARRPWPLHLWARNLTSVRERTVLEMHLERWFAGFAAFPMHQAARLAVRAGGTDIRRVADEDWATKFRRTRRAVRNAFVRRSQHDTELEEESVGAPPDGARRRGSERDS